MSAGVSAPSMRKKSSFALSSKLSSRMCIREQRDFITMSSPEVCWPIPMRAIGAQNLLTMPGGVSTAGYLHKKGGSQFSLMKWPLRYIIIHKGCVYYFKSSTSAAPQGAFSLNGYNRVMRAAEETTSSNVFPFKLVHFSKKHRTWYFSAASESERRKWMRHLRREIDHYNDRKESQIPSDSDTDADSFYGTIERPMDLTHNFDPEDFGRGYDEDDDEDEEDYLKPDEDSSPTTSGRPTGPPPSYPPPPVPAGYLHHQDTVSASLKDLAPPTLLQYSGSTSPLLKKPPPSPPPPFCQNDLNRGPPPPLPFAPHLHKPPSPSPPPPPPASSKRALQSRATSVGGSDSRERRPPSTLSIQSPATLPICNQLESRLCLNGPTQSQGSHCPRSKSGGIPTQPVNTAGRSLSASQTSLPGKLSVSPQLKTGLHNKVGATKPPVPSTKPPLPPLKPSFGTSFQRASPEGQSFRSLGEETPPELMMKRDWKKSGGEEDSDDDYENVQLPDSVFIDSTETSFVEKLFKDEPIPPQDGLYGIRNSGTKTSKVLVVWDTSIGKARNYRLFEENGCIFLESELTFPNLSALIEHYHCQPLPHHGSLCLQKPYSRTLSF
ncbi:SH3 domain-binding protein 2 [Oryzias melastigma]|uniref:SH3 domain-binding protein 2 n=2 Tax=Oryzias melastigma TaxID=30732 RepID=A0A3B3BSA5_ORYME|nr:SH3 domain-binding protein 2 isoform X1 [Oryzias melastigma]KAF6730991.1 SH3 domain-binding protein 2 [Oryzias melastigma]